MIDRGKLNPDGKVTPEACEFGKASKHDSMREWGPVGWLRCNNEKLIIILLGIAVAISVTVGAAIFYMDHTSGDDLAETADVENSKNIETAAKEIAADILSAGDND